MSRQSHQNRMEQPIREQEQADSSLVNRCCEFGDHAVRENPMLSVLTAFGVGLGIGAVLGSALAEPLGSSRRRTAETLGRRMLDSFAHVLPESVRHQVHS